MSALALVQTKGEPRIDSRLMADELGNQHQSSMRIIKAYRADFEELGILRFQIGEIKGRGQRLPLGRGQNGGRTLLEPDYQ